LSLLKYGFAAPKIAEIGNFWYKCAQQGYTPEAILTIFGIRLGVPGPHPHTKFHCSGFKNVTLQPQKSRKIAIFGINLPLMKNFVVYRKS